MFLPTFKLESLVFSLNLLYNLYISFETELLSKFVNLIAISINLLLIDILWLYTYKMWINLVLFIFVKMLYILTLKTCYNNYVGLN